jgi:hypothetical protein
LSPYEYDFDGNPTNQDGNNDGSAGYDMGAFEFLQDSLNYTIGSSQNFVVNTFESGDNNVIAAISLNRF